MTVGTAGLPWSLEIRSNTDGLNAGELRRRVMRTLRAKAAGEPLDFDAVEAILGELLANVFKYAPGAFELRLAGRPGGRTTLEVRDGGPAFAFPPPLRSLSEPGGHGLRLAAALARDFNVAHEAGAGNRVTVVLPRVSEPNG